MTPEQLLGLPLAQAEAMLRECGVSEINGVEYTAPGKQPHGDDYRVIQAGLDNSCATLIYSGFNTAVADTREGNTDGDDD